MTPQKFTWTPLTKAIRRSMAFGRATLPEIAAACGCPEKTAKNKMGKLGLPLTSRVDEPVRVSIHQYARGGRRPSWIARQVGVPVELVEIHAAASR